MNESLNGHIKQGRVYSETVWFEGSTALLEGQAVCYNWDYGTASEADARRFNRVEVPSVTNAQYFAGVASRPYAARSGGRFIEIYKPGSICNVLSRADSTIGVGRLTFEITGTTATNGSFRYEGLEGEGSCVPLQTVDRSLAAGTCLAKLDPPSRPSGGLEVLDIVDNDAIGTVMVGGTTLVTGATIGTGDCTYTLADGAIEGLRKKFGIITTEIATNDFVITVTSGRNASLADETIATVTFAGSATTVGTSVVLAWSGAWNLRNATKTCPALA